MPKSFQIIDLSHTLSAKSPTWNGSCGFECAIKLDYPDGLRVQKFHLHAGVATHMDAPSHFFQDGQSMQELGLANFIVPLYVIHAEKNRDLNQFITLEEVMNCIEKNGPPEKGSFIAFSTGWGKYFNDGTKYRADLKFPGIKAEAVEFLLDYAIVGVGIDTLSPDGSDMDFPVHKMVLARGKYILENLNQLEKVPPVGGTLIALPLKIEGATECPVRAIALI